MLKRLREVKRALDEQRSWQQLTESIGVVAAKKRRVSDDDVP